MITSTTTQNIGIEYLSWINREMQNLVQVKQKERQQTWNKQTFEINTYLISALTIFSPYLLASLTVVSLNILQHLNW